VESSVSSGWDFKMNDQSSGTHTMWLFGMLDEHYRFFASQETPESGIERLVVLHDNGVTALPDHILGAGKELFHQDILAAHFNSHMPVTNAEMAAIFSAPCEFVDDREGIAIREELDETVHSLRG